MERTLRTRVVTAVIAGLIVLGAILWGPWPFRILVWLGMLVGVWEFSAMVGPRRVPLVAWSWVVVSAVMWWFPSHLSVIVPVLLGVTLLLPVVTRNVVTLPEASAVAMGVLYLGYGGASLSGVRALPHGFSWVFLLLISIWMTDTAAFFAGKQFGGRKLWPSISPSKTISGAVAGVIGAAVGAVIWGLITLPGFHWWFFAWLGAVVSVAGQLGDLVESAYKRTAGVKDSGHILPGHGGMLDRVDSLMLGAPVLYFIVVHGLSVAAR